MVNLKWNHTQPVATGLNVPVKIIDMWRVWEQTLYIPKLQTSHWVSSKQFVVEKLSQWFREERFPINFTRVDCSQLQIGHWYNKSDMENFTRVWVMSYSFIVVVLNNSIIFNNFCSHSNWIPSCFNSQTSRGKPSFYKGTNIAVALYYYDCFV